MIVYLFLPEIPLVPLEQLVENLLEIYYIFFSFLICGIYSPVLFDIFFLYFL